MARIPTLAKAFVGGRARRSAVHAKLHNGTILCWIPCPSHLSRTLALIVSVVGAACGPAESSSAVTSDSVLGAMAHSVYGSPLVSRQVMFSPVPGEIRTYPLDTLAAVRRLVDTTLLAGPSRLVLMGSNLLVADRRTSPHLLLFSLHDGQLISSFGRNGEGPGEFYDPSWIQPAERAGQYWVYDFSNRRLSLLDYSTPEQPLLVEDTPLNLGVSLRRVVVTDSAFVANGLFEDFTLVVLNRDGEPLRRIAGTPPFRAEDGLGRVGLRLTNVNELGLRPNGRDIVLVYQFLPKLSFFSLADTTQLEAHGPRPMRASFRTDPETRRFFWNDDNESAYWGVEVTNDYVYALFQGRRDFVNPAPRPDRIHVFTWQGEFVRELVLDTPVTTFTVSADNSRLYGFVEEPHPQIAEWRMPDALRHQVRP